MASINPAESLSVGVDAIYLSTRPLPIAPTGYYDWQVSSNAAERRQRHSAVTNLINQIPPLSN
jgi:linoleate 10R-lipoxygenase